MESVPQLSEPSLSLSLPQSGLPAEAPAAGGGGAPPPASPLPPVWARARLQANKHTRTRWSPPFTKGLGGGGGIELPGGVLEASCIGQPGAAPGRARLLGSQPLRGAWEGGEGNRSPDFQGCPGQSQAHSAKEEGRSQASRAQLDTCLFLEGQHHRKVTSTNAHTLLSPRCQPCYPSIKHTPLPPFPSIHVQTSCRRLFSMILPTG